MFSTFFENHAVCEVMSKKYDKARQVTYDSIIRRMRYACRITRAIDTHPEYVIHFAFRRQQWLRYTYIARVPPCVFRGVRKIARSDC